MTDHTELKRLAAAIESCTSIPEEDEAAWMRRTTGRAVGELLEELENFKAEVPKWTEREIKLIADLERNQRMLLAAACDIGAIGKALKADMNADGDELLGMVIDLKAQNTRMLEWLKDISRTSGDKGAVMGARQLLKEFGQ
jgi:hypothetical protein